MANTFKILFWWSIILIFTGGFLWNCTFFMDSARYLNRLTCWITQYQEAVTYIMTKYTDYLKVRMDRRIERQQETLSGSINH